MIRLQEFAGKATVAQVKVPVGVKSAAILNLTEDKILEEVEKTFPLIVQLKPFETKTIKIVIE